MSASDIAGALRGATGDEPNRVGDTWESPAGIRQVVREVRYDQTPIATPALWPRLGISLRFDTHGWTSVYKLLDDGWRRVCTVPTEEPWRIGDPCLVEGAGQWDAGIVETVEDGHATGRFVDFRGTWSMRTAHLRRPSISPVSTETPRETAEPGSLTVFGYECRRTYPATWRADSGLPSALSIVVREWPQTSTSPPGISVSVYQSATCLATAEASTVGDAEAACGMRLGQVVDAIRQLLTHGGE